MTARFTPGQRVRIKDPTLVFTELSQAPIYAAAHAAEAEVVGYSKIPGLILLRAWRDQTIALHPSYLEKI